MKSSKLQNVFDRNGTEGMLDVILAVTLIFLLISCLIRVDDSQTQEKVLPSVSLSKTSNKIAGMSRVKKNVITLIDTGKVPKICLDDKYVTFEELKAKLEAMNGINHISLRRDTNLSCKWEDKIILLCRNAGIERIGIVIIENSNS
jgi:biopolymer transport protein ExbD